VDATSDLPLSCLKEGAIEELFQDALRRCLENVQDPNTSAKAKRTITIKLSFTPTGDRSAVDMDARVETKFPGPEPVKSLLVISTEKGQVVGREPRQEKLFVDPSAN
jgi:hypothetical protein